MKARRGADASGLDVASLSSRLLKPEPHNFVERPWGGRWIRRFKGVVGEAREGAMPWGEAFEIAAFDSDDEARRYPSRLRLDDGNFVSLPALLATEGARLLGEDFVARHGPCFPLLPKTLSVGELLSVQGHPAGHTEVYIIIDAEPGASLRLGFKRDVDAAEMTASLTEGLRSQRKLIELIGPGVDGEALHARIAPWFAERGAPDDTRAAIAAELVADRGARGRAKALLGELKALYWDVLDAMNTIAVEPGQVIHNATPARLLTASGALPSAEVHALGNPERKEILALEIRRPGPTFRAWDNVRFPPRDVDVAAALAALNLSATEPEEFFCERLPLGGREGCTVSVDSAVFCVEHLAPDAARPVAVPATGPHCLHCLDGEAVVIAGDGRELGRLRQGESALVPFGVGAYRVEADAPADLVRVTLPED